MKNFFKQMFQDDTGEICIGRFSLFLGLILTAFTATIDMDIEGEMTWAEAALRASPAIIGLIAYIFTRLYECKEFIAETSEKIIKAKKMKKKNCILSGLEIPENEYSIDHFVAKYWLPYALYSLPENKFPAIKIINNIKGIKMPCEWYDTRYELCYYALQNWNLKNKQKNIIIEALDRFATEKDILNPCQLCILSKKAREYCYERRNLEKYRIRWLYDIQQRTN